MPGKPLNLKDSNPDPRQAMMPQKVALDYYQLDPRIDKILTKGNTSSWY